MRSTLPRRLASAAGAALVLAAVGPSPAAAQVVDPCEPVPIPGLCQLPAPQPSIPLPGGSPSPSPSPKTKDKAGTQPGGGTRATSPSVPAPPPFSISGPNSSARVISILTGLIPLGVPLDQSILQVVGPFPVAGPAWWINDWHAPRSGGRVHLGLDIFAPHGTPLVATADGVVSQKATGALPGLYVEITDASGVQYFYCHLSAWEEGIDIGTRVQQGQVIGYVGNTGNAIHTPSHVHFEFQPGGVPQAPKPWVDRWVRLAEQSALALAGEAGVSFPELAGADTERFRLTRTFNLAGAVGDERFAGEALLFAGLQPGLSSMQITGQTLDEMSWEIDWSGAAGAQLGDLADAYRSQQLARALGGLAPWPFADSGTALLPTIADGSD